MMKKFKNDIFMTEEFFFQKVWEITLKKFFGTASETIGA